MNRRHGIRATAAGRRRAARGRLHGHCLAGAARAPRPQRGDRGCRARRRRRRSATDPTAPQACWPGTARTCSACCSTSPARSTPSWCGPSTTRPASGVSTSCSRPSRVGATRRGPPRRCSTSGARRSSCSARTCRLPTSTPSPSSVPVVVVGREGTARVPGVRASDDQGLELAVDHLVGLGHRRIAFVDGPRGSIATAPPHGVPRRDAAARPRRRGRRGARRGDRGRPAPGRAGPCCAGRARRPTDGGGRASTTGARSGCATP